MKKFIIIIVAVVLSIVNANAQLNIRKSESSLKEIKTISAYWIWLYEDANGYYLVAKSDNQFDDNFYWLSIGSNKGECLDSIDGLISIANGSSDDDYYVEDTFGGKLHLFKTQLLGEKIVTIADTGHRYAGTAQISTIYLNKAKKWIEQNI